MVWVERFRLPDRRAGKIQAGYFAMGELGAKHIHALAQRTSPIEDAARAGGDPPVLAGGKVFQEFGEEMARLLPATVGLPLADEIVIPPIERIYRQRHDPSRPKYDK